MTVIFFFENRSLLKQNYLIVSKKKKIKKKSGKNEASVKQIQIFSKFSKSAHGANSLDLTGRIP